MISNISSNYNAICKLFEFSRKNNTEETKRKLLRMAKNKEKKPSIKTKIGIALSNYTRKKSVSYDKVFTNQIKKIRPDWFVSPSKRVKENKKILIKIATSGKNRPLRKTKLGNVLTIYTTKSQSCYDKSFTIKIKKIRPDWFYLAKQSNKKILLKMAKNGEKRPKSKSKLANALSNYTRKSNGSFDYIFSKKIKKLAPNWFEKSSCFNKKTLLKIAKNKEKKPKSKSKLGMLLSNYTRKLSSTYDSVFYNEIKKIRPDWFKK